jgi:hypothetical protein
MNSPLMISSDSKYFIRIFFLSQEVNPPKGSFFLGSGGHVSGKSLMAAPLWARKY